MFISDPQEEVPSLLSASLSLLSSSSLPRPPLPLPNPWLWDEATLSILYQHHAGLEHAPPLGAVLGDSRDSGLCRVRVDLAAGGFERVQGVEGLLQASPENEGAHQTGWVGNES